RSRASTLEKRSYLRARRPSLLLTPRWPSAGPSRREVHALGVRPAVRFRDALGEHVARLLPVTEILKTGGEKNVTLGFVRVRPYGEPRRFHAVLGASVFEKLSRLAAELACFRGVRRRSRKLGLFALVRRFFADDLVRGGRRAD